VAAPSRTVPHPGRALLLLLVLIVAMLLGVLGPKLFAPSQWEHRFKVGLGLDLSSGTQVTLQAQTLSGKAPSADEMNAAVGVIEGRVNGNRQLRRAGPAAGHGPDHRDGSRQGLAADHSAGELHRAAHVPPGAAVRALQRDQHDDTRGDPLGQRVAVRRARRRRPPGPPRRRRLRPPLPPARPRPRPRSCPPPAPAPRPAPPPLPAARPAPVPRPAPARARARPRAVPRSATRAWSTRTCSRTSTS